MWQWSKTVWRVVTQPYAVFEDAVRCDAPAAATLAFLLALLLVHLGWGLSAGATKLLAGPGTGFLAGLLAYPLSVVTVFGISRIFVRENRLRSFFAVWGFGYLPTFLFCGAVILAHAAARFPWFVRLAGNPWAAWLFWAFALSLFLWKLLLAAIALRLAGNLNYAQIACALLILGLALAGYWAVASHLGWYRIPFI